MALSAEDKAAWGDVDPGGLAMLRGLCGWHIAPVRTEYVEPREVTRHLLTLPTLKLLDLLAVEMDGAPLDLTETDVYGQPRVQWAANGQLWWPGRWSSRFGGIRAQIEHGYAEAPAELVALVARFAGLLVGGVATVRVGNISVTPSAVSGATGGLEPHIATLLAPYALGPLS